MFKKNIFQISLFLLLFTFGCKQNIEEKKKNEDHATLGYAEIWCDESLKNVIEQQEEVFEDHYKYATLDIKYMPEEKVLKAFYSDSIDVVIISSMIDTNDIKLFNKKKVFPRQYKLATSGIALITGITNKVDSVSYNEVKNWLSGEKTNQRIVIENKSSGIAKSLMLKYGIDKLNDKVFAKENKKAVIDWIKENPNDVGLIDWSEVSDSDDKDAKAKLNGIKILHVSNERSGSRHYSPLQYNLNGDYPFVRDLFLIKRTGVADVSLGFASFICGEIGQKVFLKAGLLPAYQTERWIEFKGLKDIKVEK